MQRRVELKLSCFYTTQNQKVGCTHSSRAGWKRHGVWAAVSGRVEQGGDEDFRLDSNGSTTLPPTHHLLDKYNQQRPLTLAGRLSTTTPLPQQHKHQHKHKHKHRQQRLQQKNNAPIGQRVVKVSERAGRGRVRRGQDATAGGNDVVPIHEGQLALGEHLNQSINQSIDQSSNRHEDGAHAINTWWKRTKPRSPGRSKLF